MHGRRRRGERGIPVADGGADEPVLLGAAHEPLGVVGRDAAGSGEVQPHAVECPAVDGVAEGRIEGGVELGDEVVVRVDAGIPQQLGCGGEAVGERVEDDGIAATGRESRGLGLERLA